MPDLRLRCHPPGVIIASLHGGGPASDWADDMTSILIDQHDHAGVRTDAMFPLVRHGYATEAVHAHIAELTGHLARSVDENRVLVEQVRRLQAEVGQPGRDAVHLAAMRADADREIDRYLEAGRREAAATLLRARHQATAIVAEAETYADQAAATAGSSVQERLELLDHRRRTIADSLSALQRVLASAVDDLRDDREGADDRDDRDDADGTAG